mmetsp:Transcript_10639/g.19286  ORF Transcript_10639/g.19286 Transcript_10639/m.19286 type:complete len:119 (-) Transcript_10639:33-389(-)
MSGILLYVNKDCNVPGIARFYEQKMGAPILSDPTDESACIVSVGPQQTLTFVATDRRDVSHDDLRDESHEAPDDMPTFELVTVHMSQCMSQTLRPPTSELMHWESRMSIFDSSDEHML